MMASKVGEDDMSANVRDIDRPLFAKKKKWFLSLFSFSLHFLSPPPDCHPHAQRLNFPSHSRHPHHLELRPFFWVKPDQLSSLTHVSSLDSALPSWTTITSPSKPIRVHFTFNLPCSKLLHANQREPVTTILGLQLHDH